MRAACLLLLLPLFASLPVAAAPSTERFLVELRVIEGTGNSGGGAQTVDPKLAHFAKDLRALPFKELKLVDSQTTAIREGERVSLEIPGLTKAGKKRFLQVAAHGRQAGGKLRFQLTIEALKFDTLVAVPDGGTIFVAAPKGGGPALLFAFTAKSR
ncbi:MAG: hypothetical protein HYS27_11595 [Deltaproteobacteria bacterium]|nr:hypothetical protein [Deltaproteobacteria bacterium]